MPLSKQIYELLGPAGQMYLDRGRYALGRLPRVHPTGPAEPGRPPMPPGYRAALIISADLELAWAWRYVRGVPDPLGYALAKAKQTRHNFERLLALFDRHEIAVSWAVVGHLFLERCARANGAAHPEVGRLPYFTNEFWRYQEGDWFDADPGSDYRRDPAWYAPDLVEAILKARMKHEIACHSFSHIAFSDSLCPPTVADSELRRCQEIAREWGLGLKTLVFPANLAGNFASVQRHGFVAYRRRSGYELDVPRRDDLGLWQIPGGICWEKPARWPADAWIGALRRCLDRALETGTVLHLWFHPSCEPVDVEAVFPAVLEHVAAHRGDLWLTTMAGLAAYLADAGT